MKKLPRTNLLAQSLGLLTYFEQRHLVAGIRALFGCRVQKYNPVIFEMAWGKLNSTQRAAIIRHVLKLYEKSSGPS